MNMKKSIDKDYKKLYEKIENNALAGVTFAVLGIGSLLIVLYCLWRVFFDNYFGSYIVIYICAGLFIISAFLFWKFWRKSKILKRIVS